MGSTSDLIVMQGSIDILKVFDMRCDVDYCFATPYAKIIRFLAKRHLKGYKVYHCWRLVVLPLPDG